MERFRSKRLTKKQLEELWKEKHVKYYMTDYHWQLYYIIKSCTESDKKCPVSYICSKMPEYYYLNDKESNFSNCPTLYDDIDYINASSQVEKIIIKDNNNFKVATKEEAVKYAKKIQIEGLKFLKKYWRVIRKMKADGSYQLFDENGNPIIEDSDMVINSFYKEMKEEDEYNSGRNVGGKQSNAKSSIY